MWNLHLSVSLIFIYWFINMKRNRSDAVLKRSDVRYCRTGTENEKISWASVTFFSCMRNTPVVRIKYQIWITTENLVDKNHSMFWCNVCQCCYCLEKLKYYNYNWLVWRDKIKKKKQVGSTLKKNKIKMKINIATNKRTATFAKSEETKLQRLNRQCYKDQIDNIWKNK